MNNDSHNICSLYTESALKDKGDGPNYPFVPAQPQTEDEADQLSMGMPFDDMPETDPRAFFREQYPWILALNIPWHNYTGSQVVGKVGRVINDNKIKRREISLPKWIEPYIKEIMKSDQTMKVLRNNLPLGSRSGFGRDFTGNDHTGYRPFVDMSRCQILALLYYMGASLHNISKMDIPQTYFDFREKGQTPESPDADPSQARLGYDSSEWYYRVPDKIRITGWELYDKRAFSGHSQEYDTEMTAAGIALGVSEDALDVGHSYPKPDTHPGYKLMTAIQVPNYKDYMHPTPPERMASNYCDEASIEAILGPRNKHYDNNFGWSNYNDMHKLENQGIGYNWINDQLLPHLKGGAIHDRS